MAIISGMEAAKVDDVKPFEMPIDEMAMGIAKRQERADAAKKAYADAAAATNFEVRDREQDYAEKQKLIDKFNADIQQIEDDAGGDWSMIDNSQIQSAAIRMTQDKMYGHLVFHKRQADAYEKIAKEIEKTNGFVERFGDNASTSDLFEDDGTMRDATKWSLQAKLDHVSAAHSYYKDIGRNLKEKFDLIHSSNPDYIKLTPAQREELWYDFWINKKSSHMDNHAQIDAIKNVLIEDYKQTDAGKQYYQIMIRDNQAAGMSYEMAKLNADQAIFTLVQQVGASKYITEDKVEGSMQMSPKPSEPSYNPGRRGPGGLGGDKEETYKVPDASSTPADVTVEGYETNAATFDEAAKAITDTNYDLESVDQNYTYTSISNVYAVGELATAVPHRRGNKEGVAKNVNGSNYSRCEALDSSDMRDRYGNNPTAINIYDGGTAQMIKSAGNNKLQAQMGINAYEADPSLAVEYADLLEGTAQMIDAKLVNDKVYQGLKTKAEKDAYRNSRISESMKKLNGLDGNVAGMHQATYDPQKGYSTFSIKEEYNYTLKVLDKELKEIESLPEGEEKNVRKKFVSMKRERLRDKIKKSEASLKLFNTTLSDAAGMDFNANEMAIIRSCESERAHTKALQIQADNWMLVHKVIMKQSNMTDQDLLDYTNPELVTDGTKRKLIENDKAEIRKARVNAMSKTLGADGAIYSLHAQLTDVAEQMKLASSASGSKADPKLTGDNLMSAYESVMHDLITGKLDAGILNAADKQKSAETALIEGFGKIVTGGADIDLQRSALMNIVMKRAGITDEMINSLPSGVRSGINNQMSDVDDLTKSLQEKYFTRDPNGKLVSIPVDREKLNKTYSNNLTAEVLKSGASEKYKKYTELTIDSKKAWLKQNEKRYSVNPATKEGKAVYDMTRRDVGRQMLALYDENSQVKSPFTSIKMVQYDQDGKYQEVEINSDKMRSMIDMIAKRDEKGRIQDPLGFQNYIMENATLLGLRPDFYNTVGAGENGTYRGHFINADMQFSYTDQDGKLQTFIVEMPMPHIDVETAVAMGFSNREIEYGQQCASGMTGSGNTGYTLTAPSTSDSDDPVRKHFHVLHVPMVINGESKPKGTILMIKNQDPTKPLYEQLENIKTGDYEFFETFEKSFAWFHDTYEKPLNQGLGLAITRIDKLENEYSKYKNDPIKMQALMTKFDGPAAWEAYVAAGHSFEKMRSTAVQRSRQKIHDKNPKRLETDALKDTKLAVTAVDRQTYGDLTIRDANNNVISDTEIMSMDTKTLSSLYSASQEYGPKAGKDKRSLNAVKDILKQNEEGKINTKIDGEYYMLTEDKYAKVVKRDKPVKSNYRPDVKMYEMYTATENNQNQLFGVTTTEPTKIRRVAIAKESAGTMLDPQASKGFEDFLNYAHTEMKLSEPFEISSTTRSINANLAVYKQDLVELTNSDHFRGTAIDISVGVVKSGEDLWNWARANAGNQGKLKEMGIYILRHQVNGGEDHLHVEYVGKDHKNAGVVDTQVDKNTSKTAK